jgi:DNA-binding transcriptional LysR family regulator
VHVRLVESGNAVALLPDLVWSGRERPGRLVVPPGAPEREVFTAARSAGALRPALAALRGTLEAVAAG